MSATIFTLLAPKMLFHHRSHGTWAEPDSLGLGGALVATDRLGALGLDRVVTWPPSPDAQPAALSAMTSARGRR